MGAFIPELVMKDWDSSRADCLSRFMVLAEPLSPPYNQYNLFLFIQENKAATHAFEYTDFIRHLHSHVNGALYSADGKCLCDLLKDREFGGLYLDALRKVASHPLNHASLEEWIDNLLKTDVGFQYRLDRACPPLDGRTAEIVLYASTSGPPPYYTEFLRSKNPGRVMDNKEQASIFSFIFNSKIHGDQIPAPVTTSLSTVLNLPEKVITDKIMAWEGSALGTETSRFDEVVTGKSSTSLLLRFFDPHTGFVLRWTDRS